jgi:hypothetical protein
VVQVGKRKFARVTLASLMQVSSYLKLSVAVALATIALKTGAWWLTGSVSLLSDALESLVNLAGAMFALAMVTVAARPPDDDHPYGHHKAEYFSSGFEGVLIFVAALAIIWAAVQRLLARSRWSNSAWAWCCRWSARPERRAGLGHAAQGARAPLDGAGSRCPPPVHRRLDLGRRGGGPAGRAGHRLAVAGPGDRHRGGANIAARRRLLVCRSADGLMDQAWSPRCAPRSTVSLAASPPDHPLRPRGDAPRRPAPLRRPAHAHAGRLDAGPRGGGAHLGRAGADERRAGLRATIQLLPPDVEAHFDDPKDPL